MSDVHGNQPERIRVTFDDLNSSNVEQVLSEQAALAKAMPDAAPLSFVQRVLYATWLYLFFAGIAGGLVAWAVLEPFVNDIELGDEQFSLVDFLIFPSVLAGIGLFVGAAEGLVCRNPLRALLSGSIGAAIGLVGGLVISIPAGLLYGIASSIAIESGGTNSDGMPTGVGLVVLMIGRAGAWALLSLAAGLGQGIALREKRMILNGLIGGVLGGLLGGLLFDPIYLLLGSPEEAAVSRAVGFAVIGALVGLFIGLVEQWTKSAWLFMKAGPLAGKQFVVYRNPTVIGSSPKADIYLFKDAAIEPRHALVHNRGGRFEIEDCDSKDGTYVNGVPVQRKQLRPGDQIVVGKTVLEFSLRDARRTT